MNILVTGGSGFLGSSLCIKLKELGYEVSYISRTESTVLNQAHVRWFGGDIADSNFVNKSLNGMKAVFHTAALAGYWGKYSDYYRVNVKGTENIINACKINKIPFLIHTSSPSIVFNKENIVNANEELQISKKHLCYYSATKAIAEKIVLESNSHSLKTIALRPHLIYGPGDRHLLPRVLNKAKKGELRIIGDGKNQVDMIYIDNATLGHIQAWQALKNNQPCEGKAYFISDDLPVFLWDWLNNLLKELEIPIINKRVPYFMAYFLGTLSEIFYSMTKNKGEPPITRFLTYSLGKSHSFDISNAKTDFFYKPIISSDEGLLRTLEYFKNLY